MKSKILLALVGMAAMFTGCNNDATENFIASKVTSFSVAVDNGVNTRAEVADKPTRYIMELYKGATAMGAAHAIPVVQDKGTFDVILEDGQEYTALFWADYGMIGSANNEYDAADLRAVKVAKQPTKVAFSGMKRFTVGTTTGYTDVTLTHAVAQVTFEQTAALTSATNSLKVTYTESYSLNVENNSGTKIEGTLTHTFNYNTTEAGILGTSYYIAGQGDTKTMMTVKAQLNQDTEKEIPNVTCERNYRTNIKGKYSDTQTVTFSVTCDNAWNSSDNEVTVPEPVVELKVGDWYPAGATKENAVGVVFEITDGGEHGKIVSMDETEGNWNTAQAWKSSKGLPSGMIWVCPSEAELHTLYTAWNGSDSETADNTARAAFNTKLDTAISADNYWTDFENSTIGGWYVNFSTNRFGYFSISNTCKIRAISNF